MPVVDEAELSQKVLSPPAAWYRATGRKPKWLRLHSPRQDFVITRQAKLKLEPVMETQLKLMRKTKSGKLLHAGVSLPKLEVDTTRPHRTVIVPAQSRVYVLCDGSWYIPNVIIDDTKLQLSMRKDGRLLLVRYSGWRWN